MTIQQNLKEVASGLPETPGIYKFFDSKGRLLYIGKSKNLKSRVRTYFRKQSEEAQERTLIMISNIHNIQIVQTETELEALILEDKLIKQFMPTYNIKQKKFKEQAYIAVTNHNFPAFKIIKNKENNFLDFLFGPFKDKYAAENILLVIQKVLKLRNCIDPNPKNKCMLNGIGKCLGPCRNEISAAEYNRVVQIAVEFMKGNSEKFSKKISQQIEESAEALDFEEAAKLRDLNKFCQNFCIRQEFTTILIEQETIIYGKKNTFLFRNCSLLKIYKIKVEKDQIRNYFNKHKKSNSKQENIHHLIDRAYVVWVWVKQNKVNYDYID
jgi:excinuclease ABC subunit C